MAEEKPIPLAQIRAWFFDLDGTLMDTDDQTVESLARRLRFLGATRAQRLGRRLVMASETPLNGAMTLLDVVGLDAVLMGLKGAVAHQNRPTFRIIDGVKPLLEHLAARYPLAVVSTRSRADSEAFLQQHGLSELFRLVVAGDTTRRLKPHPEPVLFAAQQLGLPPAQCVMVGDTPMDTLSARRAGAWAVGVLCGFGEEAELRRTGAHWILPSTADLLARVQSYSSSVSG